VGESGADVFVFAGNWGQDRIQGFEAGNLEKIDLSAITNITDFADLLANHLRDNGGSAEIFFNANTILLEGISVSEIGVGLAYSADDFIF